MKHPVLARVFAVVLAILCLLMLLNGISGFGKTEKAQQERAAFEAKYAQRIETYVTLDQQVKTSISYDEAYEQYKALLEQHDKDAAQHRTDTALYTAEKGGNTMGANMLWEALPEVEGAKLELAAAKKKLADLEKTYNDGKKEVETKIANGSAACSKESTALAQVINTLTAMRARLPKEPVEPTKPTAPTEPQQPAAPLIITEEALTAAETPPDHDAFVANYVEKSMPDFPEDTPQEDIDAKIAELTQEAEAAYANAEAEAQEAYRQLKELYDGNEERQKAYDDAMAEYETAYAKYQADYAAYETDLAAYQEALETYKQEAEAYAGELQKYQMSGMMMLAPHAGTLASLAEGVTDCASSLAALASAMGADTDSMGGDMGGSLPSLDQMASMPPEQIAGILKGAVDAMSGAYGQMSAALAAMSKGVDEAKAQVTAGENALKEGEAMLKGQLENIWYNLGQLEEKADELREEKEKLDLEALSLDKQLMETEDLKALKNKHISTRQLLLGVPEVKRMVSENGDLVQSAESYLENYRAETQTLYTGRRFLNLLAVIGGIAGFLGIPAAYEKVRGRFWLLSPVLICLACAVGADAVNMRLGLGQMYTALFTAIFAALQLLIILPKEKTIPME